MEKVNMNVVRNQLYFADFGEENQGSEQAGIRPCVIIQNNVGNRFSSNTIVAPITSIFKLQDGAKRKLNKTHVVLKQKDYPALSSDSIILTEQIRAISKKRLLSSVATYNVALYPKDIQHLNDALALSVGVEDITVMGNPTVIRGEVYFADLGKGIGCETNGIRPVLVVQNNVGNYFSTTTIVVPIVFTKASKLLPTHVKLEAGNGTTNLLKTGKIQTENIRTIDKSRLLLKAGEVSTDVLQAVDQSLNIGLTLDKFKNELKAAVM